MPLLVYSLVWLSAIKLLLDAVTHDLFAPYSTGIEHVQYAIMLATVALTIVKQKSRRREELMERIDELRKKAMEKGI
jgi:hypothetical protein